jgi:DNA (cytosine-5)-methyltransferase 1
MKNENKLFLLIATPPCQGVSIAGKRDKKDIRNQLIKPAVEAIKKLNPTWVWMENVPRYDGAIIPDTKEIVEDDGTYKETNILNYIEEQLKPYGYEIKVQIMDAKDYGVPQSRKRLIFIMTRTRKAINFPKKTHGEGLLPYKTVRDTIGHLEPLESGERSKTDEYHISKIHNENHIKWLKETPEGNTAFYNEKEEHRPYLIDKTTGERRPIKGYDTTYKRMWWDKPSPTITMWSGSISSQSNVHPRDTRTLSVRELMLLQTMPENYRFLEGASDKEMRDMIGEAVACFFSKVITDHIVKLHEDGI